MFNITLVTFVTGASSMLDLSLHCGHFHVKYVDNDNAAQHLKSCTEFVTEGDRVQRMSSAYKNYERCSQSAKSSISGHSKGKGPPRGGCWVKVE